METFKQFGHLIKPKQLNMDGFATAAIRKAIELRTQTKLRALLRLCNVYRRFVSCYSHIAVPLNALIKKLQPVKMKEFGTAMTEAFETLKQTLITAPGPDLPRLGPPCVIYTDSSEYQVGCAMFQE